MVDIPPLPGTGPSRTQSAAAEMSSAMRDATERLADAVEAGRRPGIPLDIVSRAPVGRQSGIVQLFANSREVPVVLRVLRGHVENCIAPFVSRCGHHPGFVGCHDDLERIHGRVSGLPCTFMAGVRHG